MAHGASKLKPNLAKRQPCPLCEAKFDGLKLKDDEVLVVQLAGNSYKETQAMAKQLSKYAQEIGRPILITKPGIDVSSVSIDDLIRMKEDLES